MTSNPPVIVGNSSATSDFRHMWVEKGGGGGWMYNWHLYVMYKILTLVIIIYLLWILYCLILHIIWRMHKHAPYGSVEFHEIVEGWRLHAIWRMHNHAHPGKVWNSMNSWKSDNYTPYGACTTMHPLGKCGIPWNRGSLTITHHTPI